MAECVIRPPDLVLVQLVLLPALATLNAKYQLFAIRSVAKMEGSVLLMREVRVPVCAPETVSVLCASWVLMLPFHRVPFLGVPLDPLVLVRLAKRSSLAVPLEFARMEDNVWLLELPLPVLAPVSTEALPVVPRLLTCLSRCLPR